jgi:hypothetical protein
MHAYTARVQCDINEDVKVSHWFHYRTEDSRKKHGPLILPLCQVNG